MRPYEAVLVLNPTLAEDGVSALLERATQTLEQNGGTGVTVDRWGKRRLAYDIHHHNEGFYALLRFDAPPAGCIPELEHFCRVNEEILRFLVVSAVPGAPQPADQAEAEAELPAPPPPQPESMTVQA